ncbi:hypothetical protein HN680_02650 [Candidatus Peregrinibacteria bacterium]|jgi:hypothetical protein|nr:hypothetical protein [Bacteroidota bacterium]MBT7483645.1 hypothetical protein [Candidatus Peregrinibacteria bacterium]
MATSTLESLKNNIFYKNILRTILFIVGAVFFVTLIIRSWNEIQTILQTLNWSLFILSIFVAMLDMILFSFLFQQLLKKYDFDIDYPRIGQMFFYGQIAKYIPGRLWSVFYHATFLKRPGATKAMLFANLDLTAVGMLRSLVIAVTLILYQRNILIALIIAILGIIIFWLLTRSCWIARIFKNFFRRNQTNKTVPCQSKIDDPVVHLIGILNWVTFLIANFLVMQSAFGFSVTESTPYIAYFGIAWVVGVLSFIVPAGIGIREITFIFLAQVFNQNQIVTLELLTAIAIVYRFWQIFIEFGSIGIGFILSKFHHNRISTIGDLQA